MNEEDVQQDQFVEDDEMSEEEYAEYISEVADAMGLASPSEPVLKATGVLGAVLSVVMLLAVAPDPKTTRGKALVVGLLPLLVSGGVGAWLRDRVVPADDFDAGSGLVEEE